MAFTQITSTNLNTDLSTQISAGVSANNAVANIISLTIRSAQVANSSYVAQDDTAANTGGGYLVLTGTGFTPNCIVIIGQTNATSTSYVNTSCIRAQTQAFSAATYNIYVVDSYTGATAIKVNGYTSSSFPAWGTNSALANQEANTSFSVSLSANSDSNITYSNTTALPAGTSLLANGYFYGTVSIGTQTTYSFDVKATDAEYQDVSRTFSLTVTVTPQYKLWALGGWNINGNLGLNETVAHSSPIQVGTDTTWSKAYIHSNFAGGIKTNGTLWVWGPPMDGRLGINTTSSNYSSPVQVGALTNWLSLSGGYACLAVKTDGTLWSWGKNNTGCLGQNDRVYRSSPVQVGSGTTWSAVSSSENNPSVLALKTDGSLWSWGKNSSGQLGLGDTVYRSSPTQVAGTWTEIAMGTNSAFGIKSGGTLWSWGLNSQGQLGLNNRTAYQSPKQIGSATDWSKLRAGDNFTVALKTNGTMWSWGLDGGDGRLGTNTTTYRSSPTQIGTDTNWSLLATNGTISNNMAAIKTDGTLWVWGGNNNGPLGKNDQVYRSSPTQVGTGTWNWVSITYNFGGLAISK